MRKNTETMMKGAAMGLLAGGCAGAAGAYMMQQNNKSVKKMMKKASCGAEKALDTLDHILKSY